MSQRIKYLLGEIPVSIDDTDRSKIKIVTKKKYPQLHTLKGRGFSLSKDKEIYCICSIENYSKKINELEDLLYEIEFKSLQIETAIEEKIEKKNSKKSKGKNEEFKND